MLIEAWLLISNAFNIEYAKITTVACMIYGFTSYMMLLKVCRPMNIWHGILFTLMGVGFILCVILLPWFFDITRLDIGSIIIMVLLMLPLILFSSESKNYLNIYFTENRSKKGFAADFGEAFS